jgi:hypothetical protein
VSRSNADVITDLRELIAALDRRVPQLERIGETEIAADAARLKRIAEARIATLRAAHPEPASKR